MQEIIEGLSLSLNQQELNLNISYETLLNSTLAEINHFLDIRDKYLKILNERNKK